MFAAGAYHLRSFGISKCIFYSLKTVLQKDNVQMTIHIGYLLKTTIIGYVFIELDKMKYMF